MGISFKTKKLQFINTEQSRRERNFTLGYANKQGKHILPNVKHEIRQPLMRGPSAAFRSTVFPELNGGSKSSPSSTSSSAGSSVTPKPSGTSGSSSSSSSSTTSTSPNKNRVTKQRKSKKNLFIPVPETIITWSPSTSSFSSPSDKKIIASETDKKLFTKLKLFTPITVHQQRMNDQKKAILEKMKADSQRQRELAQQPEEYEDEDSDEDEDTDVEVSSPPSSPPPSSSESQSNQERSPTRQKQAAIPRVLSLDDDNNTPEEVRASIKNQRSAKMQALMERKIAKEARSRARAVMM